MFVFAVVVLFHSVLLGESGFFGGPENCLRSRPTSGRVSCVSLPVGQQAKWESGATSGVVQSQSTGVSVSVYGLQPAPSGVSRVILIK